MTINTDANHADEMSACERARTFTFTDPALSIENIFEVFEEFREKCPVAKSEAIDKGSYLVTTYKDADEVLRENGTFISGEGVPPYLGNPKWIPNAVDQPEHRLYRRDLNQMFTESKVRAKEAAMVESVRGYMRPILEAGSADLVRELTTPFPCVAFLEVLGAPLSDVDMLIDFKNTMLAAAHSEEARLKLGTETLPQLMGYFNAQLDMRAQADEPPADVLTDLVNATVGDRPYTRDEQILVCGFLTLAGLDTVTATLSKMLRFLAENPDHRAQLVEDPSLIPDAIEEMLRFFSIVSPSRAVAKPYELNGVQLQPGDRVEILLPSAGRDEAKYKDAGQVDFHRERVTHLAFGGGIHRCLGSHLARLELKVGLTTILEMMPDFHLDPARPPKEHLSEVLGVDELHIIVGKG